MTKIVATLRVNLSELKANPFRDFHVDPVDPVSVCG
jgi:hypothetical protein